jgi:hypothetical protein
VRAWDVRKFDVELSVFVLFRSKRRREVSGGKGRKTIGEDVTVSTNLKRK